MKICRKGRGWSHEIMSYRILDLIIKKYDLMDEFHNYDLYEDVFVELLRELNRTSTASTR